MFFILVITGTTTTTATKDGKNNRKAFNRLYQRKNGHAKNIAHNAGSVTICNLTPVLVQEEKYRRGKL
jgi:hypothetical protein